MILNVKSFALKFIFTIVFAAIGAGAVYYLNYQAQKQQSLAWLESWEPELAVSFLNKKSEDQGLKILSMLQDQIPAVGRWQFTSVSAKASAIQSCYLRTQKKLHYLGLEVGELSLCFSVVQLGASALTSNYAFFYLALMMILVFSVMLLQTQHRLRTKSLEQQAEIQKQRADLARQVAHDIRSPLMALRAFEKRLPEMDEETKSLLHHSVTRVHSIAEELLAFSRKQKNEFAEVSLQSAAAYSAKSLCDDLEKQIALRRISEPAIQWTFQSDPSLSEGQGQPMSLVIEVSILSRAIENLLQNAVESFQSSHSIEQPQVFLGLRKQEDVLMIFIQDNGQGMPETLLEKLGHFEVTDGKVNGNGLALLNLYRTLKQHGCDWKIQSKLGVGTRIELKIRMKSN